jgi:hypothetical protein
VGSEGRPLSRLYQVAAMLDDEALAALANRGLLRRAKKDLAKTTPQVEGADGERLRLIVEDQVVGLAVEPAASTCSCPSDKVCRHILAAWLHLAAETPPAGDGEQSETGAGAAGEPTDVLREVREVDDEALRKWAGTQLLRRALGELSKGLEVTIDSGPPLVIAIDEWSQTVRWLPGGGLAGMLCSCHASEPCLHRVVAVVGAQVVSGTRRLELEDPMLRAAEGAPRTRTELLAELGEVLAEAVGLGSTRLSRATASRLRTLATSAHGVDLPRLERALQALAQEVVLQLERHGQASSEALLLQAARVEALRRALASPKPGLVGRHRGRYVRVGELHLVGMGARTFRTRSGYRGLTCYFWDSRAEKWATWSEARPGIGGDFDPVARFRQEGPWQGCSCPRQAATSSIRLSGAWRAETGRLSGRESVRMYRTGPSQPRQVPALDDWRSVAEQVRELYAGGLAERKELGGVVHLRPAGWQQGTIDTVEQCWRSAVIDGAGRLLPLALRYEEQRTAAVEQLKGLELDAYESLLGLIRLRGGTVEVEPVSLIGPDGITSLGLGQSGQPAQETQAASPAVDDEESAFDDDPTRVTAGISGQILDLLVDELVTAAERGVAAAAGHGMSELVPRLQDSGFEQIAKLVERLDHAFDRVRSAHGDVGKTARQLLEAAYVVDTARVLWSVEQACGSWAGPSGRPATGG